MLTGHLANDPEFSTTQSGISKCSFRIAVQRRFANAQGVREADFINCVAWRQTADFVHRYFIKGNKMGLEGSIQVRSYDAQDGSKRWVTEIIVENVEFLSAKSDNGPRSDASPSGYGGGSAPARGASSAPPQGQQQRMDLNAQNGTAQDDDDDELPF